MIRYFTKNSTAKTSGLIRIPKKEGAEKERPPQSKRPPLGKAQKKPHLMMWIF
jgi:hypothetical protein